MSAVKIKIGYANGRVEERTLGEGMYRVGREAGDIILGDPNVSTAHAQIEVRQGRVVVTDLGSTNGTYDPSGQRIGAPIMMQPNQPIRMGACTLMLAPLVAGGGTAVMPQMNPGRAPGPGMGPPGAPPLQPPAGGYGGPQGYGPPAGGYGDAQGYGPPAGAASAPAYGAPPAGFGSAPGPGGYAPYAPPAGALAYPAGAAPGGVMDYATWADRAIGYFIDYLLISAALGVIGGVYIAIALTLGAAASAAAGSDAANALAASSFSSLCCVLGVGFPVATLGVGIWNRVYLVSKRGYSIGQGIKRLKVVDAQGNLLTFGNALVRLLAQVGIQMVPFGGLLDLLWPLWDPTRQTLHDKAIGCFVINDRSRP
jgi:uncharacterized RDD family membrane protein YckC